jgi:lipopolysaccharide heptosyltransferase II
VKSSRSPTPHAVIQPKPGIGDVIWHLPFIRAIAAVSPGGQVTFLAPPTSGARELLAAEPAVAETLYFQHSGSELQRGVNLVRLVALLRRCRFEKIWILDRTIRPALAAFLAGIPERIGVGLTGQRRFITNNGIPQSHFHNFPIEWLVKLMADMGVPFTTTEPALRIPDETLAAIGERFANLPRPWLALGIATSHPDKDWPAAYWKELINDLRTLTTGTIFLVGGAANLARADSLIAGTAGATIINSCDLKLMEATALLAHADLFIGTDSGPLNLAAAACTDAFGFFGCTPVLKYSKYIHPIVPDGGAAPGGMARISPAQVLAQVRPYLSRRKQQA